VIKRDYKLLYEILNDKNLSRVITSDREWLEVTTSNYNSLLQI